MKILLIHADHFEYEVKSKALKEPEEVTAERRKGSTEEALVVFCAVEKTDGDDPIQVAKDAANSVDEVARSVKVSNVVVYPYAHLSTELGSPEVAMPLLKQLAEELERRGYSVTRAPFGWYKSFTISCKGHPLSELSRTIAPMKRESVASTPAPSATIYKVLTQRMELYDPAEYPFKAGEEAFRSLVEKEALKREMVGGREPRYIRYCKKFGLEWEPYSDLGHMRYGPEATLILDLISEYSLGLVNSLGVPVFQVRGTNLFNLAVPAVKEHADLFGDRLYQLKVEDRSFVLRYAACHQQFAMVKDWIISYRDLPFAAYEVADSYRLEQEGELLLCFRVRKLHMPDLHIFCRDLEEAHNYALIVHKKIYEEIRKLGRDYVSVYNTTETYFQQHRDLFQQLLEVEAKPVLLNFVPERYYWVINIEYNIIDELGRPREIGTFQIDVGNSKRFGITYTDENGATRYPIIIHTALIGTLERYLFAIFDCIAQKEKDGKPTMLPVWLSPTQVRVIPVSRDYLNLAEETLKRLEVERVRADIDDTSETLSKKIRKAETNWVPYTVVLGEKEAASGILDVRVRETGERRQMTLEEVVAEVRRTTSGYPWKPIAVPSHLSRRPIYQSGN
ncbi:MAG: threonine--tRNA ligase [Candidatus Bathyarchaeia archaeon]